MGPGACHPPSRGQQGAARGPGQCRRLALEQAAVPHAQPGSVPARPAGWLSVSLTTRGSSRALLVLPGCDVPPGSDHSDLAWGWKVRGRLGHHTWGPSWPRSCSPWSPGAGEAHSQRASRHSLVPLGRACDPVMSCCPVRNRSVGTTGCSAQGPSAAGCGEDGEPSEEAGGPGAGACSRGQDVGARGRA